MKRTKLLLMSAQEFVLWVRYHSYNRLVVATGLLSTLNGY